MRPLYPPIGNRDPAESKRGPSALAARLRTIGSSAIATPLPTRLPTGDDDDDDDDDDDADLDDADNDDHDDDDVSDDDRDQEAMATTIRDSLIREIQRDASIDRLHRSKFQNRATEAFPSHLPLLAPRLFSNDRNGQKYHRVLCLISSLIVNKSKIRF
ncbi:trigger factor-like [Mycetomoellerius zeteki]|uniref:trigger factor-like n=1 Tax=Mycetomoellerius zeteki TaxID=64791 RepID=UPI00084E6553|nr:PREDICTED: trigger factor-like [Trachymyrmex zeteki]